MRKLVFSFRAILRGGKMTTLHRWMEEARKTGINSPEGGNRHDAEPDIPR
jgi:hypothetical protein